MKNLNAIVFVGVIVLLGLLSSAILAPKRCHKINAKGKGAITGGTAPQVITEVDIIGGGLLNGRTYAVFTMGSSGDFTGELDLVTKHGAIHFEIGDGQFTGDRFKATAVAVSGSGKLSGATGFLVLEGITISETDFTETIRGEICFDR